MTAPCFTQRRLGQVHFGRYSKVHVTDDCDGSSPISSHEHTSGSLTYGGINAPHQCPTIIARLEERDQRSFWIVVDVKMTLAP